MYARRVRLSIAALLTSGAPLVAAALVLLIDRLFPIVEHVRDPRAGIAMGVLTLVAVVGWPVGLTTAIVAARRAEEGSPRTLARVALSLSALGGLVLFVSCALFGILVAGLSFR